ncbi:MAG TPA: hypothetical protein EYO31_05365 [Phycisphaerales bacterium]|nr:hypothetical protein [Phycisphaerales bacterium]
MLSLASQDRAENLVEMMASLRASVAQKLGLVIPSFRIKDNLQLEPNTYRIFLRGGIVGEGVLYKDRSMVVAGEDTAADIEGIREREPVFGLSAIWVTDEIRKGIDELFVQVMEPVNVLITHVEHVVEHHAAELLTREEVASMVEDLRCNSPMLVDEVMREHLTLSRLHHILKALLAEQVPMNDLQTIVEVASDGNQLTLDHCVENVRCALRRQICANVSRAGTNGQQVIRCVALPQEVEDAITRKSVSAETLTAAVHHAALPLVAEGLPIVVVASKSARRELRMQVERGTNDIIVLSREEIVPEVDLQVVGSLQRMENASNAS